MEESILNEIKHMLGLNDPTYTVFDTDIKVAINTAIGILNQIGIGVEGFFLTSDQQTWSDLLGTDRLGFQMIKEYVYMKVKTLFDPPTASFVLDSYNNILNALEYRLNIIYETHDRDESGSHGQPDSLTDLVDVGEEVP